MTTALPDYYFRLRENGALVFRVTSDTRNSRMEMDQIAVVNLRRGDFKPHGERQLSDADKAAITAWINNRQAVQLTREVDDILRTVDHLNLTAQWVQARASDAQLEQVTDDLLMAMHDLRSVLVRKKAERLMDKSD